MIFIDSNIWCYYFNKSTKEHKKVSAHIDGILGKNEIVLNTLVVMEVAHFLIKNLGSVIGQEKVEKMLSFPFIIEDFSYEELLESVKLLSTYTQTGIGGRDATILATMKKWKIKDLLTHDSSFKKINLVNVIDPTGT